VASATEASTTRASSTKASATGAFATGAFASGASTTGASAAGASSTKAFATKAFAPKRLRPERPSRRRQHSRAAAPTSQRDHHAPPPPRRRSQRRHTARCAGRPPHARVPQTDHARHGRRRCHNLLMHDAAQCSSLWPNLIIPCRYLRSGTITGLLRGWLDHCRTLTVEAPAAPCGLRVNP